MRLPLIKQLVQGDFDEDYMEEAVEVLLSLSEAKGIKDEEMEVIGELVSNIEGAREVLLDIKHTKKSQRDALNGFMKRVMGSINN
jgi:hypothetical protein